LYLLDTDVISELRKGSNANVGVRHFIARVRPTDAAVYLSPVTVGELRLGVERIRHRGDVRQAALLEQWLQQVLEDYSEYVLPFDAEIAQVWGRLRVPNPEKPLDKQIAATALVHDLVVVTRNVAHFQRTGVKVENPFQ
jgi:predicted nucleic acid-binding protein